MKDFPRIARLSTLGIVHHQAFDYEFNAFRTDFVGEGGAGKSMIADLLQLIFVGAGIFHSPTNSTGDRKPNTMVLKSEGKGTDTAYAFLNIEISKNSYLVIGIYLESSGYSAMFIIQDGNDFDEESKLLGFNQMLGHQDFILEDNILPLDMMKDHILNSKNLTCESKSLSLYHKILYNNNILPINLSKSRKTLENYAKIIQAFSREALDISKSNKLQNFLFGDEKEKEFVKNFEKAVDELSGDVRQYEINSDEISKLTNKQQALQEVIKSKKQRDESLVNYTIGKYKHLASEILQTQNTAIKIIKDAQIANGKIKLLQSLAKNKISTLTDELEKIESSYELKYASKKQYEEQSKKIEVFFSWLQHFNCTSDELQQQYKRHQKAKTTIQKVQGLSKVLKEKNILDFVEKHTFKADKSIASLQLIINELEEQLVLKSRLKSFKDLSNKNSLAFWAINLGRKLTLEEESIIYKFHNDNVSVGKPENSNLKYIPLPENFLKVVISQETKEGLWLDLNGLYEFCPYVSERIFDTDDTSVIQKYFKDQALNIEKDIQNINQNLASHKKLLEILDKLENPDSYIASWNEKNEEGIDLESHPLYDLTEEELHNYTTLFENAIQIDTNLKKAKTEYAEINNQKMMLAALKLNLQREIDKFEESEIKDSLKVYILKYNANIDDIDITSEIDKELSANLDYYQSFQTSYKTAANDIKKINEIMVLDESLSEMRNQIKQLEISHPEISELSTQIEDINQDNLTKLQDKYNKVESEYMVQYNTVAREFLKENSKRFENTGDFFGLCSAILPPEIFDHNEMLDEDIIEKINKYLRDINTKNQTLNGRKLQKLSHIINEVDEEVSAQMHDIRTIKNFFNADDKQITGGHHVSLDVVYEGVYPKEWMRKFIDSINSDFSSNFEDTLFTPSALSSDLEKFPSLLEKMRAAFYKCGGSGTLKPTIEQLLNPKSYYDLKFSIKSEHGKKNDGSTSQTYAAIALLCMARLTLLDRLLPQGKIREGIRFMAIDEAEGLGSNFDMLFKIAKANDYQILSLSINPNKVDAQNQNIYLLHNNPEYDDINYEPIPIFGTNNIST